jgi:hypothetical protein
MVEPAGIPHVDAGGDVIPPDYVTIEVRVAELHQLFNAIDPSPFLDRDLDRNVEEFIVGWAREISRKTPFGLLVHVDRLPGAPDESVLLRDAVHEFFKNRSLNTRRRLRGMFRTGRISLVIGLVFLGTFFTVSTLITRRWPGAGVVGLTREGLVIGGWVAMWRPLEIFLYDWWPIHAEARLFDRLAAMPVRIEYPGDRRLGADVDEDDHRRTRSSSR